MSFYEQSQAENFMQYAISLGRKAIESSSGGPFGAIIVKDGNIIGEGWNQVLSGKDPTAHGEIVAIRDACKNIHSYDLSGCEIYTSGEPCPMCLGAIYWARLKKIYYGFKIEAAAASHFDDAFIFQELSKPANQRQIPAIQLYETEALKMLKEYSLNPQRIIY